MGLFSRSSSVATATTTTATATATTPSSGEPAGISRNGAGVADPIVQPPAAMTAARPSALPAQPVPVVRGEREIYFEKMKVRIHQQLVDRLDVQNLKTLPPETVRAEVRALIRE